MLSILAATVNAHVVPCINHSLDAVYALRNIHHVMQFGYALASYVEFLHWLDIRHKQFVLVSCCMCL